MKIGIIVLAAGSSTRMGESKQLLEVDGETLIARAARTAISSGMNPVVVVLGAAEKEHREALKDLQVELVVNIHWQHGMGSSLKVGLAFMQKKADVDAVIVMLCDQPLLTATHLTELGARFISTGKPIIASFYAGTAGVPALFAKSLFAGIAGLPDAEGAKKIILEHPHETVAIVFPEGSIDLDTPEDYRKFTGPK
jgi:molybdenum cofactor cytidylyltransferase